MWLLVKIKRRKIDSALREKGFIAKERDHTFYFLVVDGKKTKIHTKLSHGSKEYGDQLLSAMRKQLGLNNMSELQDLIECPMSGDQYVELLIGRSKIEFDVG